MREFFYLITSLPTLPSLGEKPPLHPAQMQSLVDDEPPLRTVVDTLFLEQDLLHRQSILAGEKIAASPLVLSEEQMNGEAPLPVDFTPAETEHRVFAADLLWSTYFQRADLLAGMLACPFLQRWACFEVSLRNAVAAERARKLALSPDEYFVAEHLTESTAFIDGLVASWTAADNPLSAARALDQGRWEWLQANGGWFSFSIDEVAAYARALLLLARWHELQSAPGGG
ncbi:MAG TPA: DUF2764 family protein [bacterium]|nr:DUF2764 family protein [bacterium]